MSRSLGFDRRSNTLDTISEECVSSFWTDTEPIQTQRHRGSNPSNRFKKVTVLKLQIRALLLGSHDEVEKKKNKKQNSLMPM